MRHVRVKKNPQEVPDTIKFFKIIEMKHESHDDAERVEKLKEIK